MRTNILIFSALQCLFHQIVLGQIFSYTTTKNGQKLIHRILMDEFYFVEAQFTLNPNQFIKTIGGFYEKNGDDLEISLEFNSNFSKDSLKQVTIKDQHLWEKVSDNTLPLNGKWLMAGRVKGDQEHRRDTSRPRKTMKILVDGYFQWIAFNTVTFDLHGIGGGTYTAANGTYTETIDYFSSDNNKVGISLEFEYERKGSDWYHRGSSSKGDPLHEIWTIRTP